MFSTRIKQIRIEKDITQEELAQRVGLSQAEISRKENGKTALNVNDLILFAAALGVSVSDLLEETQFKAVGE